MEFHKWPKIENLETERLRNSRAFQKAWEIENWIVTEKIDGTNIAVNIDHDGYRLSSRNQFVNSDFYGIGTAVHQIEPIVEIIQKTMGNDVDQITLQGEFFGAKVMGRIKYRIPQSFRFFGGYAILDSGYKRWPFSMLEFALCKSGFGFLLVPVVGRFHSFEEAIAVSEDRPSAFNPDDRAEGVVVQPVDVPIEPEGLIFKKKREDFRECKLRKLHDPAPDERIAALNAEFRDYLTVNRMVNLFTKIGPPQGKSDAGRFIGEFLNDAFGDFVKDRHCIELSAGELKAVKSAGGTPFNIFMEACAMQGIQV